jgi:hypothetical protein
LGKQIKIFYVDVAKKKNVIEKIFWPAVKIDDNLNKLILNVFE